MYQTTRMCRTRYLGPTEHRVGRVKATHLTTLRTITLAWDHALDATDNHESAARKLMLEDTGLDGPLLACSGSGGEMIWAVGRGTL